MAIGLTKTHIILGLFGVCAAWFLYAIQDILLPFILAFVLAYILHPTVESLCRRRLGRGLATGLVEGGFLLLILAIFLLIVPILQTQVVDFIRRIPQFSAAVWNNLKDLLTSTRDTVSPEQLADLSDAVSGSVMHILTAIGAALSRVLSNGIAVFNLLALVLITPVVLFYVLRDWKEIQMRISQWVPKSQEKTAASIWKEIDRTLSGFIRGQALVCVILGLFYGIGLSCVGLDFGILVGLLAGLLSFIPYFGFGTGLILSLFLGLMQPLSGGQWGALAAVFIIGQILEGYVLTPKLVGDRVGLSPVWVIFALLAGGSLAGFLGILVAVPTAAVIGVIVRRLIQWYQQTDFYRGKAKR